MKLESTVLTNITMSLFFCQGPPNAKEAVRILVMRGHGLEMEKGGGAAYALASLALGKKMDAVSFTSSKDDAEPLS